MSLLSLADAKQWLQISHTAEDTVLQILLDATEQEIGRRTAIAFGSASYVEDFEGNTTALFPSWHPVTAVASVIETDSNTNYTSYIEWRRGGSSDTTDGGYIYRTDGDIFYLADNPTPWRVTYTAGYTALTLPAQVKMLVFDWMKRQFDNRGGKLLHSGSGTMTNWRALEDSDLIQRLHAISFKTVID